MALEEDLIAPTRMIFATPEVHQADLVQGGCRGIAGDVATDTDTGTLLAMHLNGRIPAEHMANLLLQIGIAGVRHFLRLRDGIDVVGRHQRGNADADHGLVR